MRASPTNAESARDDANDTALRVVGYLPTYRIGSTPLHLDTLTHLIIAFANPDPKDPNPLGGVDFQDADPSAIRSLVEHAHDSDVKVLAALAGGTGGEITSKRLRREFDQNRNVDTYVESVMKLVEEYDLDGIDVDIEGDSIDPETYEPLMRGLSNGLKEFPERKLLTVAVAEYQKKNYRLLGAVDFLNVMSYDQCGGCYPTTACQHSTFAQARADLEYWSNFSDVDTSGRDRKIGAENVVLGVPFYGRCWGERCPGRVESYDATKCWTKTVDLTYAEIARYCAEGRLADCSRASDILTDGDEVLGYYVSLNGPDTIAAKAELAKNYGGIMIWELGQDDSAAPLFAEIYGAFPRRGPDAPAD